jgi:hypothetical protein
MIEKQGTGKDEYAIFRAEVYVETAKGMNMVSSAHKKETRGGFDDFIEKAETGAIGRALALAGFGTQFLADELEEGDRLADAPTPVVEKVVSGTASLPVTTGPVVTATTNGSGRRPSFRKSAPVVATSGDDI